MNPEITKIIDQYLHGELSEADRNAFEKRLTENETLQKEVALQQEVYESARRATVRNTVKQAGKSYHFIRKMQIAGIAVVVAAIAAALTIFIANSTDSNKKELSAELVNLMEKLEKESPIDGLKSEFFLWNGDNAVMLSQNGVLLSVPEKAFLLNGKPYSGQALIQWQEALSAADIVKSGLSTISGDRLLETQGMFGIQAFTPDGKRLQVNPASSIYVQVPVDEYKDGMQLFEGKKNTDGIVDWQNPKPLLKIPVAVDMAKLDFYPVGYGDSLDHMKLRKDKKYRDSLYLSFEEITTPTTNAVTNIGFATAIWPDSSSYIYNGIEAEKINKPGFGPTANCYVQYLNSNEINLTINIEGSKGLDFSTTTGSPASFNFIDSKYYQLIGKPEFSIEKQGIHTIGYKQKIKILTDKAFEIHLKTALNFTYEKGVGKGWANWIIPFGNREEVFGNTHISPAKVLAFWNPEFNNTNLATREFEKRMRAIHSTCNDKVLETYTRNLSAPLSELDAKVVQMGYPQFNAFAAEQVGTLNPGNPHLKNLEEFYDKAILQMQKEVRNNQSELQRKQQQWDREIEKERTEEQSRTATRNANALKEEYDFNMKNVARQLGKTIGFQVHDINGTVYNIDKYVLDATVNRTSATIVDPETGKTAKITYNEFSFEVENPGQYGKLFAYVFPSGINSYQRISGKNGKFDYPLNGDMRYDLAIVGISENGYSFVQRKNLNQGNLGKINLEKISETRLNASIEQLNSSRISKPLKISDELSWLVKEQKDYKEQKHRQDQAIFRARIASIIFPCTESEFAYK